MPGAFEWLTEALLTMMSLLGIIRVKRLQDAFKVFASMLEVSSEELYREVELFVQDRWDDELSTFDVHGRGKDYFVGQAAANNANPLLLEACCRLRNVQLTIWDYEEHSCEIYGHHGPMYNAAVLDGSFVALIGTPVKPWYEKVLHELEASTSHVNRQQPQIDQLHPMEVAPGDVLLVRGEFVVAQAEEIGRERQPMEHAPRDRAEPSYREVSVQWEDMATATGEEFEPQDQEDAEPQNEMDVDTARDESVGQQAVAAETPAMQRPQIEAAENRHQPVFRPADVTGLPAHIVAELVPPQTAPYEIRNNKIVCCLPHCKVPAKEFPTIGGWKRHVALAQYHLDDAFCALCGHHLILPDGLQPEHIKAYIKAHKAERCVGASKTVLRQRRAEAARLEALMRTASHIQLPDEGGMAQQAVQGTEEQPAARRKRSYPTEEARRADICASYLKKFKYDHPETMTEIAQYHELQIP